MKRLTQILFGLFLFTFPLSIRFLVYEQNSYRFGQFNPWVSGFVYGPEVLLLIVFGLWAFQQWKEQTAFDLKPKSLWVLLGLFTMNAYLVTFFAGDPWLGALFVLRVFEMVIVFWLISSSVLPLPKAIKWLTLGALLQIAWGFAQWSLNHDLGLALLGESHLGPLIKGVAKLDLAEGVKQIRAYGSFLHPNILAGYLVIVFFIAWPLLRRKSGLLWLILFAGGLYFTHSRAAWIVGIIGLILFSLLSEKKPLPFRQSVIMAIGMILAAGHLWFLLNSQYVRAPDASWTERLSQIGISRQMTGQYPLGVGVANFTLAEETVAHEKLKPWEFQPVHSSYYLIVSETGIQGLLLLLSFLFLLFWRYCRKGNMTPLALLILLASFDHYLWDSWAGMMLIALAAGAYSAEEERPKALAAK